MGLAVIPCVEKRPLIRNWQARSKSTKEDVEEWIKEYPNLNIGLVLGRQSGIIGIDVDGKEGLKRLKEISKGELPKTLTFITPGGGIRFLYRLPEGMRAKKWCETLEGDHSELALLGDGQQTIMPPSIHPNGGVYKWIDGMNMNQEISMAPTWMLNLMSNKKPKETLGKDNDKGKLILEKLSRSCHKFTQALDIQKDQGIGEEDWFLWVGLLINAGFQEAARFFSAISTKHNNRSSERIQLLIEKVNENSQPMVRCTTFGCDKESIKKCFPKLNVNKGGDITNSPGTLIKEANFLTLPTDPVYGPFIDAIKDSSDYSIDEDGNLCAFDRQGSPYKVANFVAQPIVEITKDDGLCETRTFRIKGILNGGKKLPTIDIDAKEFSGLGWIIERWGISPNIMPGSGMKERCRNAIQIMAKDIARKKIYTHLGWRKTENGNWVYLHSGGCIGEENVNVQVENNIQKYCLPTKVDNIKRGARESLSLLKLAPAEVTIPLLALVYLSPLVEPLKQAGIEPNFLVWLYGTTGSRKTSLSMLFLSHFGKFETNSPPASFKDTANALERRAYATKDTLLLVDDFHPEESSYDAIKINQTAQRLLRMYGDRIARGRLTQNIEFQREYPPRGMALVSGEDIPSGQSTLARFIGIEVLKDKVDLQALTKAQTNKHLLGEAMSEYIKWILPQMGELPKVLSNQFYEKRLVFQQEGYHGRLGEAASWLYIGIKMMSEFMFRVGICNQETIDNLLAVSERVLKYLINKQNGLVEEEKPEDIFIKILSELLTSGKVRVEPISEANNNDYLTHTTSGEKIGWFDQNFLYLIPNITYNAVNRFLTSRGQHITVKERTLWKCLDVANLIYTEENNDHFQRCPKKTVRVEGGVGKVSRPRLLHLYRNSLRLLD